MNKTVKFLLSHIEEILASIFIIITTVLVLVNVFMRYFLKTGLYWSEEVATSCFVWSVFMGAAAGYRRGQHIGVDILVEKLPAALRNLVRVLVQIVLLATNAYIFYLSVVFVKLSYIKPTAVLGVSSAWVSSALIVGFGLTTIYSVVHLIQCVRGIIAGPKAEGEVS